MKLQVSLCLFSLLIMITACSSEIEEQAEAKILIDIGDSLTYGYGGQGVSMSSVALRKLGEDWTVKNMGVGGENTLTIGARYGAMPMYIKESISIPGDGSKVEIPTGLYSSFNHVNVLPLLQGAAGINPCYIDNVKCKLTRMGGSYYLNRIDTVSSNYTVRPYSKIHTALSQETDGVATIFIGQNGGYSSPEEFLEQIDLFAEHKGDQKIIIISSHGSGLPNVVQPIAEKYGERFIDLKSYMSGTAIYDAIEFGLLPDDGTYPTINDLNRMQNGLAPASLLIDNIHFNQVGYELLGRLRYKKGQELGYW